MELVRHTGSVLLLLLIGYLSNGQSQPAEEKKKNEFKISANYNTGLKKCFMPRWGKNAFLV